jgi:hypothetical protein
MRFSSALTASLVLAGLSFTTACSDERTFVGAGGVHAFAMTEATPAFIAGEDATLYMVESRVMLPIEAPSEEELGRLSEEIGTGHPFPRRPWVSRGDLAIEIDWTMSNLEDQRIRADLTINGINEFHEYAPAAQVVDDEVVIDFSQWERTMELEPLERRQGTIREEELDEVTVDLATVVNGAPNSHMIVYFESQSATDPRSQMYIPSIIPGLTGVELMIRSFGCGGMACRIVVEATIRVRDTSGKLTTDPQRLWELPVAMPFIPMTAAPPP